MENLTIKTNNQYREILTGFDIPKKFHDDFDYMENIEEGSFFKYKNQYYALDQFMRSDAVSGWDAIHNQTYFSGILIKLSDCGDSVLVGRYYS